MKEEVAKKLVEAARSGRYKQTTGCLRKVTRVVESGVAVGEEQSCFCILGIVCDLFAQEHEFAKWQTEMLGPEKRREAGFVADSRFDLFSNIENNPLLRAASQITNKSETSLPKAVSEWSGLQAGDGVFEVTDAMAEDLPGEVGKTQCLMGLNDDYLWSLERIADFVEKHWMHI